VDAGTVVVTGDRFAATLTADPGSQAAALFALIFTSLDAAPVAPRPPPSPRQLERLRELGYIE
jgi:hypothetical protein